MATIVGSAASNVSKSSRSDSTQVTFPAIAGAASGDTAYLFHSCDGSLGSSVPSGWTQIDLDNGTSTDWLVASRVITGDSDYTSLDSGFDPGQGWTSMILLVRGSHTLEAFADDNDGDAIAYVYQITGFNSGDLSVIRGTADDQQVTMTPPTGWTLFANDDGTDGSNTSSAGLAYKVSAGGTEGQLAPGNGDEWSGPSSDGSSSFHMRFSGIDDPDAGGEDALLANDVESASEVTTPSIGQEHSLAADDVESASQVTAPALGTDGTDALTADDVEAASEVTAPALGQVHVLFADDIEAASEVTAPALGTDGVVEPPVGRGDDAPGMRYGNEREGFWRKKADDWLEEYLDRIPEVAKQPKRKKRKLAAEFEAEFAKISQEFVANSEEIPARVDAVAGLIEQLKQPSPDYSALAAMVADIQAQIQADRTRRRRKRDIEAVLILAA